MKFNINEEDQDNLTNRFTKFKDLKTYMVFSIDDIIFPCSPVELAFSVGFVPNMHWPD